MICTACAAACPDTAVTCPFCGVPREGREDALAPHALPFGSSLMGGGYTVGRVLGQGGFGITYRGGDRRLRRPVALKEFFPQGSGRAGTRIEPPREMNPTDFQAAKERFLEEARVLAQFHHPGIVRVFHSFEENGTAYMAMECIPGETLLRHIEREGALPEPEVLRMAESLLDALETIHRSGWLHRDLKPENLMIDDRGRVVLVDFGSAREFTTGKTRRMTTLLTPGYAPLEQYGKEARFGAFTDLYSLGATLYHALTGQPPTAAVDRATGVELPPPHRLNGKISPATSRLVLWAMEMSVRDRPQTAEEYRRALQGRSAPRSTPSCAGPANAGDRIVTFKFSQGEAFSTADLAELCDRFPAEAESYLYSGYFERWLAGHLGEASLAQEAKRLVSDLPADRRKSLERFVRSLCRSAGIDSDPVLVARPDPVDLGALAAGSRARATIRLKNRGRGCAWGRISLDPPLEGVAYPLAFEAVDASLEVDVETLSTPPGVYRSMIVIEPEGCAASLRLPLYYEVLPLRLEIDPPALDLGRVPFGTAVATSIFVESRPRGGPIQGRLFWDPPIPGLSVEGSLDGPESELQLVLNTGALPAGSLHETRLRLQTNGGDEEIPVRFRVGIPIARLIAWIGGAGGSSAFAMGGIRWMLSRSGFQAPFTRPETLFLHPASDFLACGLFGVGIAVAAGTAMLRLARIAATMNFQRWKPKREEKPGQREEEKMTV